MLKIKDARKLKVLTFIVILYWKLICRLLINWKLNLTKPVVRGRNGQFIMPNWFTSSRAKARHLYRLCGKIQFTTLYKFPLPQICGLAWTAWNRLELNSMNWNYWEWKVDQRLFRSATILGIRVYNCCWLIPCLMCILVVVTSRPPCSP